jgi:hypothetical protein
VKFIKIIVVLSAVIILGRFAAAQQSPADKWTRLQTDNGQFSIEVPEGYSYFYDADGFQVSDNGADYRLREVNFVNAFHDGTLVSFEVYRGRSGALEPLAKSTLVRGAGLKKVEFKGIEAKEIVKEDDQSYFVSRYFRSKEFIYVVSALSRKGETPVMKRFFQSLIFAPGSKSASPDFTRLSTLHVAAIDIRTKDVVPVPTGSPVDKPPAPGPDDKPVVIASKPRAHYIDAAREKNVQGSIQLRLELAANGYIPRIEVLKVLPQGLFRQVLFAALRIKFLPAEKNRRPVAVRKVLEYTFAIY